MTKSFQRDTAIPPNPLLHLASLGLMTFVFTLFSLELTHIGTILAPVWFPTAIMLVAFYRHAGRMWPGIIVACTLGSVGASLLIAPLNELNLWYPVINVAQALMGALLLRRMLPQYNPLKNLNDWVRLTIGSAIIPPLFGSTMALLIEPGAMPLQTFLVWLLSEIIGAMALVPLGLLFKTHYLTRHRDPRLLTETLVTLSLTLILSTLAILYIPWPFTCIIVLLMWSAVRLPRVEAFLVFLTTVMAVSVMMATHSTELTPQQSSAMMNAPWLPFLMMLLPANIMTMVMYAFRSERKHITESEERFRNAMEYSAIGMALIGTEGQWLQVNKSLCRFLGYSQDELRELTFQQLTWPEDLHNDLEKLQQLVNGEIRSYSMEKRYYTRDGDVVWALLAVSVVRHTNGTPLYFISQIEDINDLKTAEQINKRLMERITLANEAGGIGIWEWDIKPDMMNWDKRMFELYDIEPHIKPSWDLWQACMIPEDRHQAEEIVREGLRTHMPFKLEFRIQVKDGIRHIRSLADRVLNKNGEVERLLGINMDMTEVKTLNEQLYQEKERLHITLDSIGEAVLCTDIDMRITFMNPVAEVMSGWTQQQAIGHPVLTVLRLTHGEQGPLMENLYGGDALRPAIEQDVVLHCRHGGSYDIHYSITPLSTLEGQSIGTVLVIQDVTESRKMMRQLSYSASHDALTHLANRVSFENHLKRLLQTIHETRQRHALVFIDLDRFKAVNDTAGHAAGDALLRELAALMLSMLRNSDVLARLGGDEFGLLLPNCNQESARYLSGRLIHAINDYHFMWEGRLHRIGASAGITLVDENNCQASEVMSQADIACYASKSNGRGVVTIYEPQQELMQYPQSMMSQEEQRHMIKENHMLMLARGVASPRVPESCHFWLISLRLWTSEGEVMEEQAFRSALEEPELMHALDQRVFREFFRNYASTVASKGLGVALPLSGAGLASTSLIEDILDLLAKSPMASRLLHLVINADALNQQETATVDGLRKLRMAGCKVILSHVGHELELFNHLTADMIDYLMLDQDLITNVHGNLMDEMVITIIQGHAKRLELQTIAGPTNDQWMTDTLSGIGIDMVYGDTISRSQPLDLLINTSYFAIN